MKSTQLKVSRNWNSVCDNETEIAPKTNKAVPAPMFSRVYKITSVENSGSFTWHGYNINLVKKVDDVSVYQMAKDFCGSLKNSQAKSATDNPESNY